AGHQLKRTGTNLLARAGDADDDRYPPSTMAALERLAHQLAISDALDAVIGASLRQFHQVTHDVTLDLLGIDEMRHAELARQGFPRRIDIDANDHVRARHAGPLDDIEPDAPEPEDDDVGSGFHLGCVDHRSDA